MIDIKEQLRLGGRDDEDWYDLAVVAIARIEQLEAALRENDPALRLLVDIVWQHATESTAVPFHKTSDMLIAKYRAALAQSSSPEAST